MNIEINKSQRDSQLSNYEAYAEGTKLSLANVLLEWQQNNSVSLYHIPNPKGHLKFQ